MEGARIPEVDQTKADQDHQDEWETEVAKTETVEEAKEAGSRRREENSKWSHLPSLEQLLEKNGYRSGQ